MPYVKLGLYAGESIERAAEAACQFAELTGVDGHFTFNGLVCVAFPEDHAGDVVKRYYQRSKERREE